jgi:hypothetical protein
MKNEPILDNSNEAVAKKTKSSKFTRESYEYFCAAIEFVFLRTAILLFFIYELVKLIVGLIN